MKSPKKVKKQEENYCDFPGCKKKTPKASKPYYSRRYCDEHDDLMNFLYRELKDEYPQ